MIRELIGCAGVMAIIGGFMWLMGAGAALVYGVL